MTPEELKAYEMGALWAIDRVINSGVPATREMLRENLMQVKNGAAQFPSTNDKPNEPSITENAAYREGYQKGESAALAGKGKKDVPWARTPYWVQGFHKGYDDNWVSEKGQ